MNLLRAGVLLTLSSHALASPSSIPVRIDFIEALAPRDTTSSERFQKEYEAAISTAKALVSDRLAGCGYSFDQHITFFDASDSIQALEKGKASEASGAWLIVGPRRSNHYVLLAKGALETASISTMASSDEVAQLGKRHLSAVANNREMARVAATEAKRRSKSRNPRYVSVVSQDCVSCIDFAAHFKEAANRIGLKLQQEIQISGESPETLEAINAVRKSKPDFVLLPNYSKTSAILMAALQPVSAGAFFVGGDGWGDAKFGFVQDAKDLERAEGFTVRGFPSPEEALKRFRIGRTLLSGNTSRSQTPAGGPTIALLRIIEGATDLLCAQKPKSKTDFLKAFEQSGSAHLRSPWGVSIYNLRAGNISFQKVASEQP